MEDTISIIMAVYNQEDIIENVLNSILENISENTKEIIIIIDGCVDNSETIIKNTLSKTIIPVHILYASDVGEILSCNMGFKISTCKYSITTQDDMVITEKDFDKHLLEPFKVVPNLFAVSSRNAQDENIRFDYSCLDYSNVAGMDVNSPRNILYVRDVIVRGQIIWDNEKLRILNYLDEEFAPQSEDDKEISLRAYTKYGWLVGAYRCDYISKPEWGASRKYMKSYIKWENSYQKNQKLIIKRYRDYLLGKKHDQDIIIKNMEDCK